MLIELLPWWQLVSMVHLPWLGAFSQYHLLSNWLFMATSIYTLVNGSYLATLLQWIS